MDLSQASHGALLTIFTVTGPILAVILVIGVIVSLFLAVTQVNEPTLSFVPKFLAAGATIAALGPWLLHQMEGFAIGVFTNLPQMLQ
jgi:flagellar biosynthetic protein FliQ